MLSPEELRRIPLVVTHPAMEQVQVQPEIVYKTIGSTRLLFDLYLPPVASRSGRTPTVIFISGDGPEEATLHHLMQSAQYTGWGRLVAAHGMIGLVTNHRAIHEPPNWYVNVPAVATDIHDLLTLVQDHGAAYGIDVNRLAIWTCSGGQLSRCIRP